VLSFSLGLQADGKDDAAKLFNGIYQADLARVRATSSTRDDVELAKSMLRVVNAADAHPGLLTVICYCVYDLASKDASGFGIAIEAMKRLSGRVITERDSAQGKMLTLYQAWYRQGDRKQKAVVGKALIQHTVKMGDIKAQNAKIEEAMGYYRKAMTVANSVDRSMRSVIAAKLKRLATHRMMYERLAEVQARFNQDPGNAAVAAELIRLHLVELDDPDELREAAEKKANKKRSTKPRAKHDPKLVKQARELRDRYLEAVNERGLLPGGWTDGKYDVSRALESDERIRVRPPEARFLDVAW